MKAYLIFILAVLQVALQGQEFECDGKIYLVSYTESTGISTLYEVIEDNGSFSYTPITLSENRRLTSLSYNVLDRLLYALDVDSYELVKIQKDGVITSLGRPENIDTTYTFHAGTIAPDGSGIFLIGHNSGFGFDDRFYSINLTRENYNAGHLGLTNDTRSTLHDIATSPISGEMFGYDNKERSLAQVGLGGGVSSLQFVSTGIDHIDGLFFNKEGDLFAYSATSGFYDVDQKKGGMTFLSEGPSGTSGDACSCPYTSTFMKDIQPRQILPCSEFTVTYTFQNRLGIGQTWIDLRDTFPEGFEIIDIQSSIVSSINIIPSEPNVIALENLIYVMRDNEIKIIVRAPSNYLGDFKSQATQWDFVYAFGETQVSDDPLTESKNDMTLAEVVTEDNIDFDNSIDLACDGNTVTILSPIIADSYFWSTGDTNSSIIITEPGWYDLLAENECVLYFDSVFIEDLPEAVFSQITSPSTVTLGDEVTLQASVNRGEPILYEWFIGTDTIKCEACDEISFTPVQSDFYKLETQDADGCRTTADTYIEVADKREFYSPSAFSPNNDGINDYFYLSSSTEGVIKEIRVFNRWGNEVYSAENVRVNEESVGWDGRTNGRQNDTGVYIWVAVVEYFDGFVTTETGSITLLGRD